MSATASTTATSDDLVQERWAQLSLNNLSVAEPAILTSLGQLYKACAGLTLALKAPAGGFQHLENPATLIDAVDQLVAATKLELSEKLVHAPGIVRLAGKIRASTEHAARLLGNNSPSIIDQKIAEEIGRLEAEGETFDRFVEELVGSFKGVIEMVDELTLACIATDAAVVEGSSEKPADISSVQGFSQGGFRPEGSEGAQEGFSQGGFKEEAPKQEGLNQEGFNQGGFTIVESGQEGAKQESTSQGLTQTGFVEGGFNASGFTPVKVSVNVGITAVLSDLYSSLQALSNFFNIVIPVVFSIQKAALGRLIGILRNTHGDIIKEGREFSQQAIREQSLTVVSDAFLSENVADLYVRLYNDKIPAGLALIKKLRGPGGSFLDLSVLPQLDAWGQETTDRFNALIAKDTEALGGELSKKRAQLSAVFGNIAPKFTTQVGSFEPLPSTDPGFGPVTSVGPHETN